MPDIVIADWVMPNLDGLELTQMIRQSGLNANPYVPIIMLSGYSEKERVAKRARRRRHGISDKADFRQGALRAHPQRRRQPAPFIKTKTYFGPDRRRNVNATYVGPERRKGGKADGSAAPCRRARS